MGIFEASVRRSLIGIDESEKFGIVSTGKVWEKLLSDAVENLPKLYDQVPNEKLAGVETTGLDATELHDADPKLVRQKIKDATMKLVKSGDVGAVCLGCAGMAGMDEIVREGCVEALGGEKGERVLIVDGVQAGIVFLHTMIGE